MSRTWQQVRDEIMGPDPLAIPGERMRFTETDLNKPWWHDVTIPAGNQVIDLDAVANVFLARAAAGGKQALKLGHSGNFREGMKTAQYIKETSDLLAELTGGAREVYANWTDADDKWPYEAILFWERGAMKLTSYNTHADAEIITDDPRIIDAMREHLKVTLVESPAQGSVYMMTATRNGPAFHSVGVGGHELERGNYAPEVLEAFDRICTDIKAKTPRGRLSILDGAPGCGKTYLIRGMLSQVTDVLFVVVPPHFLPSLAEPSSLSAVTKLKEEHEKPIVFVVEDADECLATRDAGNMSAVSMVLNLGDGIIGSVLDIRIVATTNAKHQDLDPAIKRPGRLTAFQTVGALSPVQANAIYTRLTGKVLGGPLLDPTDVPTEPIKKPMTLAEIYQLAYDAGWRGVKSTERKVGFGAND